MNPKKSQTKKNRQVSIRFTADQIRQITARARAERRTRADIIRILVEEGLQMLEKAQAPA